MLIKNIEHKIEKIFPSFIEKTIYYIVTHFNIKKIEKITKIFQELDSKIKNNKYLSYNKVIYVSKYYKENKKISLESFNNIDKNNK